MPQPKLLIATRNPGKLREYRGLLLGIPFQLVSLDDLGITEDVEETGLTFHENAQLKTTSYAALGGLPTLADDSGLEVDALGGEPGIYSARYGGDPDASDQDRVRLLLRNLEGVPWERRTARFRCVIAIATSPQSDPYQGKDKRGVTGWQKSPQPPFLKGGPSQSLVQNPQPRGDLTYVVGSVAGMIQYEPMGDEGFGYDPVFYLPSYGRTIAQLPLEEKNRISHRSDAARKAVAVLKGYQLSADC